MFRSVSSRLAILSYSYACAISFTVNFFFKGCFTFSDVLLVFMDLFVGGYVFSVYLSCVFILFSIIYN